MPDPLTIVAGLSLGYLVGSIPFGWLLTQSVGQGDIRQVGSGNIGATNVLRTGRKGLAAIVLMLDMAKGAIAVLVVALLLGDFIGLLAGAAAVLGHDFPLWLQFRGGKGVATTLGVLTATAWQVGLVACGLWLAMAVLFRVSSLAALVALISAPVTAWILEKPEIAIVSLILAALGWIRHTTNIQRLLQGAEPRIGEKKL